jgi:peptide/nickel transport system substrate-binding protein
MSCTDNKRKASQNTFTIQLNAEPTSLSPLWGSDANRLLVLRYTTQTLLMPNPEDGETVPVLAESLPEVSDDGKQYRLKLRAQAAWHDGRKIRGEDLLFSMKCALATESPKTAMRDLFVGVEEVRLSPENELTVEFEEKNIINESFFVGLPIIDQRVFDPEGLLKDFSINDLLDYALKKDTLPEPRLDLQKLERWNSKLEEQNGGDWRKLNSGVSGPYTLDSWEASSHLVLRKVSDFWAAGRKEPWFAQMADTIVFRFVNDPTALRLQIRQEAFDIALQIPGVAFNDSLKTPEYAFQAYHSSVYTYIAFNVRNSGKNPAVMQCKPLRKALAHLIPVDQIIEDYYQGRGVQVFSPIATGKKSYNDTLSPPGYKPERAVELLNIAEITDSDSDLIREVQHNRKRIPLQFELLYPAGVPPAEATALRLRDEGKKIGITIEIVPLAFGELFGRVMSHNYEAALLASSINPFPYDYGQDFGMGAQGNHTGFSNSKLDSLISIANRSLEPEKRNAIIWEIQAMIHEEKPVIYLFNTTQPVAIHNDLKAVRIMPFSPYVWCNTLSKK